MDYTTYLVHHGILGMKWGVRRYQNKDGSLTEAGRKRYATIDHRLTSSELISNVRKIDQEMKNGRILPSSNIRKANAEKLNAALSKIEDRYRTNSEERQKLEAYIESEKDKLLVDSTESWRRADRLRKQYEEFLQTKLSELNFDDDYEARVFLAQHYDDIYPYATVVSRKDSRYDDGSAYRWFGGYDSYAEYAAAKKRK